MPESLAERLGFSSDERVAVVHVDDIGMCHAANEGGFEALENGPATCGSIMVPCPWFREAARRAAANPRLDLGVHLTLNAEWEDYRWGPVAPRAAVPSLLDDQGYLPHTVAEVAGRARPEEVAVELRAQVQTALDAGIDVTHVDSHMGTCFQPQFLQVYADLAREFAVPVFIVRPTPELLAAQGLTEHAGATGAALEAFAAAGVPIFDAIDADSLSFAPGAGEAHNLKRIAGLGTGVTYLICHAARGGEELDAICPQHAHMREFERTFYGGAAGRAALEAAGVRTVGMRALRDLMRA